MRQARRNSSTNVTCKYALYLCRVYATFTPPPLASFSGFGKILRLGPGEGKKFTRSDGARTGTGTEKQEKE